MLLDFDAGDKVLPSFVFPGKEKITGPVKVDFCSKFFLKVMDKMDRFLRKKDVGRKRKLLADSSYA